jgi:putative flippase GtrA
MSGLIALKRDAFARSCGALRPVGTKFAVELVARIGGPWVEVPVHAGRPADGAALQFDDLRQFKRLIDHRFGNYSRLVQFCIVGASGAVVDLSSYAAFQWLLNRTWLAQRTTPLFHNTLALTVSAVLAVWLALSWNFSLNRRLTFSYARQGSLLRQYVNYAVGNLLAIFVSLCMRLLLPRYSAFFNAHKLAAAVVGIVTATGISFTLSRWWVFRHHHRDGQADGGAPPLGPLDAVPPGALGQEQGAVGATEQARTALATLKGGDPAAHTHPGIDPGDAQAAHSQAEALRQRRGTGHVGMGQHDHEFVPSIPGQPVATAQAFGKAPADLLEHPIANGMPKPIVDGLKAIDIDHQAPQRNTI